MSDLKKFEIAIRAYETGDFDFIDKNFIKLEPTIDTINGKILLSGTSVFSFEESFGNRSMYIGYKVGNEVIIFIDYRQKIDPVLFDGFKFRFELKTTRAIPEVYEVIKPIIGEVESGGNIDAQKRNFNDVAVFKGSTFTLLRDKWNRIPVSGQPKKPLPKPPVSSISSKPAKEITPKRSNSSTNLKKFEIAIQAYEIRDEDFIKKNFDYFTFSENTLMGVNKPGHVNRVREFIFADLERDANFYGYKNGSEYILFPNYNNPNYPQYDIKEDGDIYRIDNFKASKDFSNEVIEPIIVKNVSGVYVPGDHLDIYKYVSKSVVELRDKWKTKTVFRKPKKQLPKPPVTETPKESASTEEINWADLIEETEGQETEIPSFTSNISLGTGSSIKPPEIPKVVTEVFKPLDPSESGTTANEATKAMEEAAEAVKNATNALTTIPDNLSELQEINENIANTFSAAIEEETKELEKAVREQEIKLQKESSKKEENKLEGKLTEEETKKVEEEVKKESEKSGLFGGLKKALEPFLSFLIDLATFKALQWLADKDNQGKIKAFFDFMKPVAKFVNFLADTGINNLFGGFADIADVFDFSGGFKASDIIEKPFLFLRGIVKTFIGISFIGALLGKGWGFSILKKTFNFIKNIPDYYKGFKTFLGKVKVIAKSLKKVVASFAKFVGTGFKNVYRTLFGSKSLRAFKKLTIKFKRGTRAAFKPLKNVFSKILPRLSSGGVKGFLGTAGKVLSKIPFLGALIDFAVNKFIFGLPTDESAVRAIGSGIGAFIAGAVAGAFSFGFGAIPASIAGGIAGDFIAGKLYDIFKGTPKLAEGGIVSEPTLAIIGEAGTEYVIPENKIGDSNEFPFAKDIIGATSGFFGGFGSKSNLFINDVNNMLIPLKREYGEEPYNFGSFITPTETNMKYNILGLSEEEMTKFRTNLEVIGNKLDQANVKTGTESGNVVKGSTTSSSASSGMSKMTGITKVGNESKKGFMKGAITGIKNAVGIGKNDLTNNTQNYQYIPDNNQSSKNVPKLVNPVPSISVKSNKGGYAADTGLDIHAPIGTIAVSPVSGILEYAVSGRTRQAGQDANPNMPGHQEQKSVRIRLDSPFTYAGKTINFVYMTHLYELNPTISNKTGIKINAGDYIGKIGVANSVPHLHIGFVEDRNQTKYLNYIEVRNLLSGAPSITTGEVIEPEESDNTVVEESYSPQQLAVAFESIAIKLGLLNKRITKKDVEPEESEKTTSLSGSTSSETNLTVAVSTPTVNNITTNTTVQTQPNNVVGGRANARPAVVNGRNILTGEPFGRGWHRGSIGGIKW